MTQERIEELMVKVIDEVATPSEKEELMAHVAEHPELQRELEAHSALKAVTDGWVQRLRLDLLEDQHHQAPLARVERGLGVTLVLAGTAVLSGWGIFALMAAPDVPLWARAGTGLLVAGILLLLLSVIRWRLATVDADPYTEVNR